MPDIFIIGAGVSGLTTALVLLEAGAAVRVVSAAPPTGTTSAVAGAMIGPVFGDATDPTDPAVAWGTESDRRFRALAGEPGTGVSLRNGLLLGNPGETSEPPWAPSVPGYRPCSAAELPPGFSMGFRAALPFVDMPVYLAWLSAQVASRGGVVEYGFVDQLGGAPVVVNCAGVAAGRLTGDPDIAPVWGQHVIVDAPAVSEFLYEGGINPEWTSVMPHGRRVVLGGARVPGRWSLTPDPRLTDRILARARAAVPALSDAAVLGVEVGLRPGRPRVRLEREVRDGTVVVHNYGHSGNGVMLSWGCAQEAARLALS